MCFKGAIGNGANVSFFFTSQMRMTLADCGWLQAEKHFFLYGAKATFSALNTFGDTEYSQSFVVRCHEGEMKQS